MIALSVQEDLESECFIKVIQVLLTLQVVEQANRIERSIPLQKIIFLLPLLSFGLMKFRWNP